MATITIETRHGKTRKTYAVRYKCPATGKSKYYKSFRKKGDAQKAREYLYGLLENGGVAEVEKQKKPFVSKKFAEVADICAENWQEQMVTQEIAKSTYEGFCYNIKRLKEDFGKQFIAQITNKELKEYFKNILVSTSAITANRRMYVLKKIFEKAQAINAIPSSPMEGIRFYSEKAHERNRYLTPEEVNALLHACQKSRSKHYMPVVILLGTDMGASRQEILDLKWKDVDFKKRRIRLYRTKNQYQRTRPMSQRLYAALKHWKKHLAESRRRKKITSYVNDRVICHLDGTPFSEFRNAWQRIRKMAHIHDCHFHDLRHTFCTNLLEAGMTMKDIQECIGHRDPRMTDRYTHVASSRVELAFGALEKYYAEAQNDF